MNAVDLGLSVLWADCNVGASKPEEPGGYFSFGETLEKNLYNWDTYKWWKKNHLIKYYINDYRTELESTDDVAVIKCGNIWKTPSYNEYSELYNNCKWIWTDNYNNTGIKGQILISYINGNSIFLPAVGYRFSDCLYDINKYGYYWSSSVCKNNYNSKDTWSLSFGTNFAGRGPSYQCVGKSIRPVMKK